MNLFLKFTGPDGPAYIRPEEIYSVEAMVQQGPGYSTTIRLSTGDVVFVDESCEDVVEMVERMDREEYLYGGEYD